MPVDRSAIDAQLKEIGEGERWWEQREFRDLPYILHADERIRGIVRGKLLGRRRPRLVPAGSWLVVATDQRLLCLRQERFARKQVEIVPGQILRVVQRTGFRTYQIRIETPQRRYRIRIPKADAFRFAGALAPLVPNQRSQRLPRDLEPWSWIPGMNAVAALPGVAELISKVSMAPPPEYAAKANVERLEATVERLEGDVERLQQQVDFLESLLEQRAETALLSQPAADS